MKEFNLQIKLNNRLLIKNTAEVPLLSATEENALSTESTSTSLATPSSQTTIQLFNIKSTFEERTKKQQEESERLLEYFRVSILIFAT